MNVYDNTRKEGYFALARKPEGTPDILGIEFNKEKNTVIVHFSGQKKVEVKNYRAVLQRKRTARHYENGSLVLSRKELILSDIAFELKEETLAVEEKAKGLITNSPKLLKLKLPGFMNENTKTTDALFVDWLIHAAHKAKRDNALLLLEEGSSFRMAEILKRASKLYPTERFVYSSEQELPESHKNAKSVTLTAFNPEEAPHLEENQLYLISQTLEKGAMHNLTALIQTALVEAEVGLEGMRADNPQFDGFRNVYEALGVKIGDDINGFIQFTKGIGLNPQKMEQWAIPFHRVDEMLRAYALGARMAEQSA